MAVPFNLEGKTEYTSSKVAVESMTKIMAMRQKARIHCDEDGWFNTKDKVYPIEVESKLLELDGVLDACVHGADNPLIGKMVVAELFVSEENNNREFVKKVRSDG